MTSKTSSAITNEPARDARGFLLAEDGLPRSPHPRAEALALKGRTDDPLGLVPSTLIAAYRPKKPIPQEKQDKE